ncbi:MAG: biotin/lipoyl-containing protein [Chloroflexota bacterium]|nr:biotin/lipoyl-containing protein [Chloroflexota bacterium]
MKRFKITINDRAYDVEVGDVRVSPVTVTVDGQEFAVEVERESTPVATPVTGLAGATAGAPAAAPTTAGAGQVIAPMPGTVMDIAVRTGDVVKRGQRLCNLEAMKMKSPILSTSAGRVLDVRVYEGKGVNYGDVLFVLEA